MPETTPSTTAVVSVVMACFNSVRWLEDAAGSVLGEREVALELILVDDGSRDETRELISRIVASEPRARGIFQEHSGVASARNAGVAAAVAPYILLLDADDQMTPGSLESSVRILDECPDVAIVYGDREEFGDSEGIQRAGIFALDRLKYFNQLPYCALYRRTLWDSIGGYRTNVDGFDDWDFWIAAAATGCRAHYSPQAILRHRRRGDSQMSVVSPDYERLFARIILNNPSAYTLSEWEAASGYLAGAPAPPLLASARYVFMAHFSGKLSTPARSER